MITINDTINLRQIERNDAQELFQLIDDNRQHLETWLTFIPFTKEVKDTISFIEFVLESNDEVYTIRDLDKIIGLLGFKGTHLNNGKTEIGYWIAEKYQGKGVVTLATKKLCKHAFLHKNINRIQIKCAVGNTKSSNIPKRLGFILEGIKREGERKNENTFRDLEVYSLLGKEIYKLD